MDWRHILVPIAGSLALSGGFCVGVGTCGDVGVCAGHVPVQQIADGVLSGPGPTSIFTQSSTLRLADPIHWVTTALYST